MYMTYNPTILNGSNITGVYQQINSNMSSQFYIPATLDEVSRYKAYPNLYRIDEKAFVEIPRSSDDRLLVKVMNDKTEARDAILSPILIDDREYIPDIQFQINVSLSLHVLVSGHTEKVGLWCKVDNAWVLFEHTRDQMLAVANSLVERRERISAQLYKL